MVVRHKPEFLQAIRIDQWFELEQQLASAIVAEGLLMYLAQGSGFIRDTHTPGRSRAFRAPLPPVANLLTNQ